MLDDTGEREIALSLASEKILTILSPWSALSAKLANISYFSYQHRNFSYSGS
ncbi:hypothetical protein IQ232_11570 [Microcystis aeruginosa LEGE 11464]|uniref:hypothetical protein n=1 Tax=Microcystis TaxID=1125 RepID=UPI00187EB802|nr:MULTISPECIES: hypothetical protein [Microcystis]MBE9090386.1 hypothetical protein [Microcystis aeruginosa LEGE 11464]MCA2659279.1 hypothetical protein [Microcystis sp. M049S2]MCZ8129128.1 hypothetical protein [Microcystis sp. LE19-114.1B]